MVADINLTPTASLIEIARTNEASSMSGGRVQSQAIPARTWGTAKECLGAAVLVHGLGAHSGWFEAFGRRLKLRRIFALSYDQVGFGKRRQETFVSYTQWLEDLHAVVSYLKERAGEKPLYIMGNSMGAAVSVKAVSTGLVKPNGLVLFSPGFDGYKESFTLPFRVKALWQALLRPDTEIDLPYSLDLVASDPLVRQWLSNDPEKRFSIPARMLLELLKMTFDLSSQCRNVTAATLMFTAGKDKIVSTAVAKRLFEQFSGPKKLVDCADAWHDLMFDPVIDKVVEELAQWVADNSRVPTQRLISR